MDSGILDILDVVDSRTFPRKRPRMPPKRVKIQYFLTPNFSLGLLSHFFLYCTSSVSRRLGNGRRCSHEGQDVAADDRAVVGSAA